MTSSTSEQRRRFSLLAVACLVLAGGLGFAIGKDAVSRYEASSVPGADEAAEPRDAAPSANTRSAPEGQFVPLGQFVVPVVRAGQTISFALMDIVLSIDGPPRVKEVADSVPRYRDAIFQAIYAEASVGAFESPDFSPAKLAQRIRLILDDSIPGNPVAQVLFNQLLLQENRAG